MHHRILPLLALLACTFSVSSRSSAQSALDGAIRIGVGYIKTDLAPAANFQWSLEPMFGPVLFSFTVLNAGVYDKKPAPRYRREELPGGTVLCMDAITGDLQDGKRCDSVTDVFFGASADIKIDLSRRNRAFFVGVGHRAGIGRSPYLSVSVGPAPKTFPLYIDANIGTEHISVVGSWRLWAWR